MKILSSLWVATLLTPVAAIAQNPEEFAKALYGPGPKNTVEPPYNSWLPVVRRPLEYELLAYDGEMLAQLGLKPDDAVTVFAVKELPILPGTQGLAEGKIPLLARDQTVGRVISPTGMHINLRGLQWDLTKGTLSIRTAMTRWAYARGLRSLGISLYRPIAILGRKGGQTAIWVGEASPLSWGDVKKDTLGPLREKRVIGMKDVVHPSTLRAHTLDLVKASGFTAGQLEGIGIFLALGEGDRLPAIPSKVGDGMETVFINLLCDKLEEQTHLFRKAAASLGDTANPQLPPGDRILAYEIESAFLKGRANGLFDVREKGFRVPWDALIRLPHSQLCHFAKYYFDALNRQSTETLLAEVARFGIDPTAELRKFLVSVFDTRTRPEQAQALIKIGLLQPDESRALYDTQHTLIAEDRIRSMTAEELFQAYKTLGFSPDHALRNSVRMAFNQMHEVRLRMVLGEVGVAQPHPLLQSSPKASARISAGIPEVLAKGIRRVRP